jgi:hypothetical protein
LLADDYQSSTNDFDFCKDSEFLFFSFWQVFQDQSKKKGLTLTWSVERENHFPFFLVCLKDPNRPCISEILNFQPLFEFF